MTMRIHLIRHGRPSCGSQPALSRHDYKRWLEAYDATGIIDQPPLPLVEWLNSSGIKEVVSSALPRAVESAIALIGPEHVRSDPLFNEAAITVAPIPFRMSSNTWTVFGRVAWLCGASANEMAAKFRLRARIAADNLTRSPNNAETALIGHGWMNRMIGRELRERGFEVQYQSGTGYWSRTTLSASLANA